jgi:glycerophosphoryl diester phosphodiesterase
MDKTGFLAKIYALYGLAVKGPRRSTAPQPADEGVAHDAQIDAVAEIKRSGLFDSDYYLQRYPDVAASGKDPVEHYVYYGAAEGRNPCAKFNTRFYLRTNREVAEQGINPFLHYVRWGLPQGRAGRPPASVGSAVQTAIGVTGAPASSTLAFQLDGALHSGMNFAQLREAESLLARLRLARILLHVSQGAEAMHHIDAWLEFCRAVDKSLLVVVRSKPLFERIARERPDVDASYVKGGREVEWLINHVPQAKVVLYVSNGETNIHFIRYGRLTHVFVGHGDSEKSASCGKQFRYYDEVWVAGRGHIDRFKNSGIDFSSLKFRVVGRPQVRPLVAACDLGEPTHFLYLPTWEGYQEEQNYSSVRFSEIFIPELVELTKLDATVKFHPFTGKQDSTLPEIEKKLRGGALASDDPVRGYEDEGGSGDTGGSNTPLKGAGPGQSGRIEVIDKHSAALELMGNCSFLVTDISSVITDFLITGRPIFVYLPDMPGVGRSPSRIPIHEYCYIFSRPEELLAAVKTVVMDGRDVLRDARTAARDYLVDMRRTLNDQFEIELGRFVASAETAAEKPAVAFNSDVVSTRSAQSASLVVAHRGVTDEFPENSLGAFRDASALAGLDAVELDVHLAGDGSLVVMHDADIGRTTNGEGIIGEIDAEYLAGLRLLDSRGDISDEPVPVLEQVLDILGPTELELHIELKNSASGAPYPGLAEKVLAVVRERGLSTRCVLTSFTPSVLEEIRFLDGTVRLLASVNSTSVEAFGGIEPTLRRLGSIGGCTVALERKVLLSLLHGVYGGEARREYGVWVVNDKNELHEAFMTGYRQITTDCAKIAIQIRDEVMTCKTATKTARSA